MLVMTFKHLLRCGVLALALTAPLACVAADGAASSAPGVDQAATSKLVFNLLSQSQYAYRPRPLDTAMSEQIFDNACGHARTHAQHFRALPAARGRAR